MIVFHHSMVCLSKIGDYVTIHPTGGGIEWSTVSLSDSCYALFFIEKEFFTISNGSIDSDDRRMLLKVCF